MREYGLLWGYTEFKILTLYAWMDGWMYVMCFACFLRVLSVCRARARHMVQHHGLGTNGRGPS